MHGKEIDRRIGRTRMLLQDALFSLMQEKPYNKITIQEIIDKADVGRSTFYSHYETKDDLLFGSVEHLLESLNHYIINYLGKEEERTKLLPVIELFDHFRENSKPLKGLMKAESSVLFFEKVQSYWNKSIEDYLKKKMPKDTEPKIPFVILSNHITSTLIQLIKWWINNKMPYTSVQMDQYFQFLINPCIDLCFQTGDRK